ncbi:MAG: hypothetical protein KAR54_02790 [Candidatus Pacebacteria bacterium]|nr:hypothetical protein [Candidatus Paceibacterota bacterium]
MDIIHSVPYDSLTYLISNWNEGDEGFYGNVFLYYSPSSYPSSLSNNI